jgi:hypothetical protein
MFFSTPLHGCARCVRMAVHTNIKYILELALNAQRIRSSPI